MHRLMTTTALLLSSTAFAYAGTDTFVINYEEPVSDGVPGAGAGNLETATSMDIYTFNGTAGDVVYFEEVSGSCAFDWMCEAPSGTAVFNDGAMCAGDPGTIELAESGTYTITVASGNGSTGTYAFTVWSVEAPDEFTIGLEEQIELDAPGPGAGNLEEPGAIDRYEFTVAAGTTVFFEETDGTCFMDWRLLDASGTEIFNDTALCVGVPGHFELDGTYTIEVFSTSGHTGTYAFVVWDVEPFDVFEIGFNETVLPGLPGPGAGVLPEPGAIDIFTFEATAGDEACFAELEGTCFMRWNCENPDGTMLFEDGAMCVSFPGRMTLPQTGTYTITVYASESNVGEYGFSVNTGKAADFDDNCIVDVSDLLVLLGAFGTPDADITGDGTTDVSDLLELLATWG